MQIVETNLQFSRAPSKRTRTGRIILHHTASADVSAATIHGWHQGQGWIGIGYHYVIRANGTIERGRPEDTIGSHSGPQGNGDSIGVVLTGNFEIGAPATAQITALASLIKDLRGRYGNLDVIGHKDVMATACPGKNFPWAELKKRLEVSKVVYKTLADVPDWAKPVIQRLIGRGSLKGDDKGNLNLSDDLVRTLVILDREGVVK